MSLEYQLRNAYESEGMTPLQIAEDQSLDVTAVKAKLMQISSKYRKDCGQEEDEDSELNFNNSDLKTVNKIIMDLAISAEDEHLRFKAATYIRDDKKGRKEVVKAMRDTGNFNILNINQMLITAREQSLLAIKKIA